MTTTATRLPVAPCDTCGATGILEPGTDPESGVYGGTECPDCAGTGDLAETHPEDYCCRCCGIGLGPDEGCRHDPVDVYCTECAHRCPDCRDDELDRAAESLADYYREQGDL